MISGGPISHAPISALRGSLPLIDATLAWLPTLPAHPARRRELSRPSARPSYVSTISPIPNPAPPVDLTWQPQFPVRAQSRRAQRLAPIAWVPVPPIFFIGMSWLPVLRTLPIRRRPQRPAPVIMGDVGATLAIAKMASWLPTLRGPIRRPAQRHFESGWQIAPAILLNAAACVEWMDETSTSPDETDESVHGPGSTDETQISSGFDDERIC